MTTFYDTEGQRAVISDRKHRLFREAEQERLFRRIRRRVVPARPATAARRRAVEWGPWLQGGEPLHLCQAGAGLS